MNSLRTLPHRLLPPVLAATLLASLAIAQTAQITGRVTDKSGAVIPGATITVVGEATGLTRTMKTNEAGYFAAPLLPPGAYKITVGQQGFKSAAREGIVIEVDQRAEINFELEVGAITEQIEVKSTALLLNTVDASRGQVIENQRIVDMPLNGRNYNELALLSAGTVSPPAGSRYGGFSSGGTRVTGNNFLLDGIDNNGVELAGAQRRSEMVQPSIDAIQEFKVQTNAYAAEYGRAMGSVVNVTTKSGTNQLHGTAFEFLRNDKLDAKNFFDDPDDPKPPFKRNQYGFAIGGPVYVPKLFSGRNKLFFFGDYEATRPRESTTTSSTLPTQAMRNGNFSEVVQSGKAVRDPAGNQPFPNNTIPASRIDAVARTLVALYPDPLRPGIAANYTVNSPISNNYDKGDVRVDWNVRGTDNIFWRLSKHSEVEPAVLTLPSPAFAGGFDSSTDGVNTGLSWNHIWTPNLIMSVRGGWNFSVFRRDNPAAAKGELLSAKYGIKGGNNTLPGGFSAMNISGYAGLGIGASNPVDRDSQNRQLAGDLTWTRGRHMFKMGANVLASQNNIYNMRNEVGGWTFNARYTGDGMADFLLGMASQWAWQSRIQCDLRSWYMGAFVQDDWKVTPRLTLSLGTRYEVVLPFIDKYDRMGIFDITTDPANPRLVYAGAEGSSRYSRALYSTDRNNLMPRVGFAYKLSDKTVVRSGYGMFYGYMDPFGDATYLIGNPPNAYGVTLSSSATTPAAILAQGPAAGATDIRRATGLAFSSYERHPPQFYAQQWNFNIQRELGRDWLWEIGYSGSKGTHLVRRYDDNFSPPGPGDINGKRLYRRIEVTGTGVIASPLGEVSGYHHDGKSAYNGLITSLEKRFSGGFTVLLSYSFSKTIGDTCGVSPQGNTAGCGYQDLRYLNIEKSLDNQDIPHRFVVSSIYDLPFGRGRMLGGTWRGPVEMILGGWSIGSILSKSSGLPFSITTQGNPANTGSHQVVNRANVIGDPYPPDFTRSLDRDFNTAAFARNNQFEIGNSGRNILRERSEFNWDFSAMKNFQLREYLRLQFRFEAFHFTNTPRFGGPAVVFGTNTFGQITSADTPRNLQFGLKLIW